MSPPAEKKVWLITGCSSGLGHNVAAIALEQGDVVIATARNPSRLGDLAARGAITEALDVTWSDEALATAIAAMVAKAGGRIDILVNNAGYILAGAVEECSRAEVQATFETNVFGQLNVIRAVLPYLRQQRSGVVANLGSIGGWHGSAAAGLYCATKACATIVAEALRAEVAHLGIQVTCIEPGYTRTDFLAPGHKTHAAKRIDDLRPGIDPTIAAFEAYNGKQPGDPIKAARLIVDALAGRGAAQGRELPPRLLVGKDAYEYVRGHIATHEAHMKRWEDLATNTNCDDAA